MLQTSQPKIRPKNEPAAFGARVWSRRGGMTALFLLVLLSGTSWAAELHIRLNQLPVAVGPYLDIYEDPGKNLVANDIAELPDSAWTRVSQGIPTTGMSNSNFWFRTQISGEGLTDQALVLTAATPTIDLLEFYFFGDQGMFHSSRTGDAVRASQLEVRSRYPTVPFEFSTRNSTITLYIKGYSSSGVELPLTLSTPEQAIAAQQSGLLYVGAFFMLMALALTVSLILNYYFRETAFVSYSIFFLACTFFFLTQTGLGKLYLWPESVSLNTRIAYAAGCFLLVSLCLFGQSLQLVHKYRDSICTVLRFLSYTLPVLAGVYLFIPYELFVVELLSPLIFLGLLMVIVLTAMTGVTALQGSRVAVYLFFCWATLLLAYFSLIVYMLNILERGVISSALGQTLTIIGAIFLLCSLIEMMGIKNGQLSNARAETKAKGDFLKNVSREFLTPVHLILANSKRLLAARSRHMDESTKQHITTVIRQSDHLHNLINDLLEMAEIESDSFEPEFELIEMSHFLTEVRDMMSPTAMEKNLELESQFASANLLLQTDKARLQHAIINLITNAIKYTDEGMITIGYKAAYFRRRLGIEIFIQDTGRGMSESFKKRLFQEFSREDEISEKDPSGTGLGLVIVKRMIEKLGGEITFESEKDRGSLFYIRLPLRNVP